MTIYKETLVYRQKGSLAEKEDWYRLCYDDSTGEFFIEHEWNHVDPYRSGPGTVSAGTQTYPVDTWDGDGADRVERTKQALLERTQG